MPFEAVILLLQFQSDKKICYTNAEPLFYSFLYIDFLRFRATAYCKNMNVVGVLNISHYYKLLTTK